MSSMISIKVRYNPILFGDSLTFKHMGIKGNIKDHSQNTNLKYNYIQLVEENNR